MSAFYVALTRASHGAYLSAFERKTKQVQAFSLPLFWSAPHAAGRARPAPLPAAPDTTAPDLPPLEFASPMSRFSR